MTKWKPTPLAGVLRHRKGSITIDDSTSYKLCRVQLHRRGVVLRQHLRGAEIRTKSQQVCRTGDFLIAEMDAKVGGYGFVPPDLDGAIVSSHYFLFEVDTKKLHPPYLEVVSQAEILQQQIVAKGSTNYASVRPSNVLGWQIPLPHVDVQKRIARNFQAIQKKLAAANEEITRQQSLLGKLKQAILQEAIQGKLTAGWRAAHPDVEPASRLLLRIQAEKARLVAARKLRPEKPPPKITPVEIPFEIPKGWEWCRLGTISTATIGLTYKPDQVGDNGVPVLRANNIVGSEIATDGIIKVNASVPDKKMAEIGDILICVRSGSKALIGKCAVIKESGFSFGAFMTLLRSDFNPCLFQFLQSAAFKTQIDDKKSTGINQLTQSTLNNVILPLPPFAEQAAIVERVEALMTICRALEAEIERARTHAADLLQAVLKEAFAGAGPPLNDGS